MFIVHYDCFHAVGNEVFCFLRVHSRQEQDRIGVYFTQALLTLKTGNLVPVVTQIIIKTSNGYRRFTRLDRCFVSTKQDRLVCLGKHYAIELSNS